MAAESVTVMGLGLMGSALARAVVPAGLDVHVWNRTPAKARALAGGLRSTTRSCRSTQLPLRCPLWIVSGHLEDGGAEAVVRPALGFGELAACSVLER